MARSAAPSVVFQLTSSYQAGGFQTVHILQNFPRFFTFFAEFPHDASLVWQVSQSVYPAVHLPLTGRKNLLRIFLNIHEDRPRRYEVKVLMINGSPDISGCIHTAMMIAKDTLAEQGIEAEELVVGNRDIRGCIGCRKCKTTGKCVFNDLVNETAPRLAEADGLIIGSPVFYGTPNGTLLCFLQRLF
jgi:hypothetical protein